MHEINDERTTITGGSGAAVSAMLKDVLPNVPQSETCENKFHRVTSGSKNQRQKTVSYIKNKAFWKEIAQCERRTEPARSMCT